ncbi:type II toxin-antitoxin system RelB family antitoxin [Pseudomonas syringae group genomosp. 3]|uniref:type II toxin-antitoxin system RelB family antitoxin n=1 Tax=Pseudomonas syringae group genomosp. 3 TaxID=251701 RepID=UPI000F001DCB|nr:antitoxin [Pseudomonas syringae group genomosp. 3]
MNARISSIVSEFETEEPSATHDKWFHAQVHASINDPAPNIPHDQVMNEMRALLKSKQITATYSD